MPLGIRKLLAVVSLSVVVSAAVTVGAGSALAAPVPPTAEGLVSHWSFDDDPTGTTAADAGPGGNTLSLNGAATFGGPGPDVGVSNPGTLAINGTGSATGTANLLTGAQNFSMTVWVNLPTPLQATEANLLSINGKAAIGYVNIGNQEFSYTAHESNHVASFSRAVFGGPVNAGWHLLAFTYGPAGISAYQDGAQVNQLPSPQTLDRGTSITFGDPSHPLAASFDDARIYDRELSPNEIRGLAFSCANVTQIPRAECQALVDLYLSTDSTHWTNSNRWLATNTPCSWAGVGCTDNGHVQLLGLPSNGLAGPLPASLGDLPSLITFVLSGNRLTGTIPPTLTSLTALQTLSLRDNALSGSVPSGIGNMTALAALNLAENQLTGDVAPGITGLTHLTGLDITDNGIYPTDASARDFLASFDPNWLNSQTIPPTDVHTTAVTPTGATLTWTPIAYTGDGGYYEVLAVDPDTGDTTPAGRTTDKTATHLAVTGLAPGPAYSFVVRTVTPPHGSQLNTVTSELSGAATPAVVPPGPPAITSATPGNGTVTVAFTPPASDGGAPVTGYTVTADPGGGTTNGTASPITVAGLTNGVAYTFTVAASNSAGPGDASAPSAAVTPTAPTPPTITTEDSSPAVSWGSWAGVTDAAASGGLYRLSATRLATAAFAFTGTSATWLARVGPDRGRAVVAVDGVVKATVDLYSATPGSSRLTYAGLANRGHLLTVTALGSKRPAATAAGVAVDGFLVGASTSPVQESAGSVIFDAWTATGSASASGGSYRSNGFSGATASFRFTGSRVDWITAYGPAFGRVAVAVDGGPATTVDLYRSTSSWRVVGRSFPGLGPGTHTITVRVLGSRNAASRGTSAIVDAFRVTG